ncbi:TPA: helix-turn-helix transcriptional regulator [Streptococcus suis]|uniref:LexA family transcriptional regulator n=1 Tax=Streptococcus suis TaxID=1307 RepID=UPI0005CCBAAB|nr:XRE family transcriptional regulator [Streptococcus suis]HEM4413756.1 helix-turn-helix transcriptional regulator [Streptococcus suis]
MKEGLCFQRNVLKKRRKEKNFSQSDIAKKLKVNRSAYHNWENEKNIPNQKNLTALAALLEVPVTYFESEYNIVNNFLQLNDFNKVLAEEYMEDLLQTQREAERKVVQLFPIEVLDEISLSAGPGQSFADEYETCTVYSDEEQYGYDFATWIKGTSMSPKYSDGEVALINETGFDYSGEVYAIYLNGQTFIKKVYKEADHYRIVSINDDYPDKYAYSEDEFRIVGKVIGHFMPVVGR